MTKKHILEKLLETSAQKIAEFSDKSTHSIHIEIEGKKVAKIKESIARYKEQIEWVTETNKLIKDNERMGKPELATVLKNRRKTYLESAEFTNVAEAPSGESERDPYIDLLQEARKKAEEELLESRHGQLLLVLSAKKDLTAVTKTIKKLKDSWDNADAEFDEAISRGYYLRFNRPEGSDDDLYETTQKTERQKGETALADRESLDPSIENHQQLARSMQERATKHFGDIISIEGGEIKLKPEALSSIEDIDSFADHFVGSKEEGGILEEGAYRRLERESGSKDTMEEKDFREWGNFWGTAVGSVGNKELIQRAQEYGVIRSEDESVNTALSDTEQTGWGFIEMMGQLLEKITADEPAGNTQAERRLG